MPHTVLTPPKLYHSYQNILQCYDTIIASYIASYDLPYHWLFSEHWGFFYYDAERFYYREHYTRYPLWDILRKVYRVRKTLYVDIPLEQLLEQQVAKQGKRLFMIADEYDLPWTPEYQNIHHPHYFLVTEIDQNAQRAFIHDWWPAPYQDWFDLPTLSQSYDAMGQHAFELSAPSFQYCSEFLLEQMELAYRQMAGWEHEGMSAGIFGVNRFKQDIVQLGQDAMQSIDRWFYMVKLTIEAKYLFLEYTIFLKEEHSIPIPESFTQLLEQTINAWFSFRNTMMTSKIRGALNTDTLAKRMDRMIELETDCALAWRDIIVCTRQSL